jgi:hypothetical protein
VRNQKRPKICVNRLDRDSVAWAVLMQPPAPIDQLEVGLTTLRYVANLSALGAVCHYCRSFVMPVHNKRKRLLPRKLKRLLAKPVPHPHTSIAVVHELCKVRHDVVCKGCARGCVVGQLLAVAVAFGKFRILQPILHERSRVKANHNKLCAIYARHAPAQKPARKVCC